MADMITPAELPTWVPGDITAASDELGWKDVALRAYDYAGQDVHIPPMRDFMIVSYRRGETFMERRFDGAWTRTRCAPGSVSLLTRSQQSHWNWTQDINVTHIYLQNDLIGRVANEVMERSVAEVRLRDVLNVADPVITGAVDAIQREAESTALGGMLYAQTLGCQLALHLLRHYADIDFRPPQDRDRLTPQQQTRLIEFVDSYLHTALDLETLAGCLGLGVWSFSRRVRHTFGCAPYAYVIERRLARARQLLATGELALKEIAAACGFADQAHMTRVFKSRLGVTPGQYRQKL